MSYPRLSSGDRAWIEAYRRRRDALYRDLIGAHFTLVFGLDTLSAEEIGAEAERLLAGVKSIDFELTLATINKDRFVADTFHEFLVPEKGYAGIAKLHDRLYSGLLRPHLRLDIDYIPHVGIGNGSDPDAVKARVEAINARGVAIAGSVETVDLIELRDNRVRTLRRYMLD